MSPKIKNFRIVWRCKNTGMEGHGNYVFSTLLCAENFCNLMNLDYENIFHWVEKRLVNEELMGA